MLGLEAEVGAGRQPTLGLAALPPQNVGTCSKLHASTSPDLRIALRSKKLWGLWHIWRYLSSYYAVYLCACPYHLMYS
jgi:hypothetical protein